MKDRIVLKVGGAELASGPVLEKLADALVGLAANSDLIVVHGGGPEIADLQQRLGLTPRFVDGLRVTDDDGLWVAEMVLSGAVNKRLTASLVGRGTKALGISGVDAGILRARRLVHPKGDLGRVGEITSVNDGCLSGLLAAGFTPVVSPISLGDDGRPFNVNADHAALAISTAMRAAEMIFVTNVPGVLVDGAVIETLTSAEAECMIADGTINGGMIPKVRSALRAVADGAGASRITNLEGLASAGGTRVVG